MRIAATAFRISLLACICTISSTLYAQSASISGRVIDAETGNGLADANVIVTGAALKTAVGDATDAQGSYVLEDLPPGSYKVTASRVDYKSDIAAVVVTAGEHRTLEFALTAVAVLGQEVVVSISRRKEKMLEAPAAVSVVSGKELEGQASLSPAEHILGLPAVDMFSVGLTQKNVVVRGFNNIFSGMLLAMIDNRIAHVPALRLNAYNFYTTTNEDIDRIEVVSGPGSALYGPNSANGVLHIITKSPFDSPGTLISLGGGERGLLTSSFRHAGVVNNRIGYKVSAQYYQGDDWVSHDRAEPDRITKQGDTISNARDFDITKLAGDARLDFRLSSDMTLIFNGGSNLATNLEATGLGWAQSKDWRYSYLQGRFLYKDFFAQAFYNKSDAGDSRLLRPDSLSLLVDKSSMFVVQVQHGLKMGDRQQFTYGIDLHYTRPETEKTINGRNEDDDDIDEFGVYVQSETAVTDQLDLVVAGRYDDHNRLEDPVISPRAALVYKPTPQDNFRLTYNRAFGTPTTNTLFLDLIAASQPMNPSLTPYLGPKVFDVWGRGVPASGYNFNFVGGRSQMISLYGTMLGAPNAYLPPDVNSVWPAIRLLVVGGNPALDPLLPAALGGTVPGVLMVLNTDYDADQPIGSDNQPFLPPSRAVSNLKPIKEVITTTIELGYKGLLTDKLMLEGDVYQSKVENFVGPLSVETPHVFMNSTAFVGVLAADITARLIASGMPPDQAQAQAIAIATGIAQQFGPLPIGLISPEEVKNATDVIVTYRNFDESMTLVGGEIGFTYLLSRIWQVGGNFSYVDKNFFPMMDGVADVSLNAPKTKYAFHVGYSDAERRLDAKLRFRYVGSIRSVASIAEGVVDAYTLVDLNVGYDLPVRFPGRTRLSLSVLNLLDNKHYEFVGAPEIGRLMTSNITYWF